MLSQKFLFYLKGFCISFFFPVISMGSKYGTTRFSKEGIIPEEPRWCKQIGCFYLKWYWMKIYFIHVFRWHLYPWYSSKLMLFWFFNVSFCYSCCSKQYHMYCFWVSQLNSCIFFFCLFLCLQEPVLICMHWWSCILFLMNISRSLY